ncbi:tetratricopeptide repeat protein [Micromonospora sp. WMMD1082]|uniref:ATP-binding protein n=1 Tax=Micromonospora sp. WMMD1082 TaxID=3016104 RepID=UPI0024166575|nr:tetratricopeptide repeat protein [Micromonospora sp. WMMD1082]MDG4796292.1 tetratricopeptide repeat protein [Micromonospora sp. WMMD1082]
MAATAGDPHPGAGDRPRQTMPATAQSKSSTAGIPRSAERLNLQARSSSRVYQAAGDQHIYDHQPPAPAAVSNTLPRDTAALTGRSRELRDLIDRVTKLDGDTGTIPIHAIDGMPGVGKSALAIRAGHLLARRFPDGQFFIDLHAHSSGRGPVRPADALFGLLAADGVDAGQIPGDVDARAALWRGRMAGKRTLVIFDNAAGREQVEALLPGAANCLVLITSRRRLTGLSARHAAVTLALGTLSPEHAAELFATRASRSIAGAEATSIHELVSLCGNLPLAICLLAAKLRPEPQWQVADLVQEMMDANHRLSHMQAEDIGVAAAFDLSYRRLPPSLRRFFRRLGLHPGTELDRYAAAALDAISPARAQRQLDALYHDHLIDQPTRGRYRSHDLIREFAQDRVDHDSTPDNTEAITRMLNYYQYAAYTANRQLSQPGRRSSDAPAPAPAALPSLHTRHEALAWMNAELGNLFACVTVLSVGQQTQRIIAVAASAATYLRNSGPWDHAISLHRAAATAARRTGNRKAHAHCLRELGTIHRLTGNYESASATLHHALDLYHHLNHPRDIADTLTQLAGLRRRTGDHPGAIYDLEQALILYEDLDDLHGQANALNEIGVVHHQAENHHAGIQAQRRALTIFRELGDRQGEADALNQLGGARQVACEYRPAIEAHQQALDIYRDLGDRHGQARALNYLGAALCETGEYSAAENALTRALIIHQDLGYRLGQANALNYLGTVRSANGEYSSAERSLTQALTLYRDLGYPAGQADALNQLGAIKRLTGQHQAAAATHDEALTIVRQLEDPLGQAQVHNQLGQLLLVQNQPSRALDHHQRALHLARKARNPREEAQSTEGIGRCCLSLGNQGQAMENLNQARDSYHRLGAIQAARNVAGLIRASREKNLA